MRIVLVISFILICCPHGLGQQANTASSQPPVPQSVINLLGRAKKLSEAGKGQLAITLIQEAIKIAPDSSAGHLALGDELAKAGRFNEAIAEFELARKINPRDDKVYLSVGLMMLQQKKYSIAASLFQDAALLNPGEPLYQLMRGAALARRASQEKPAAGGPRPELDVVIGQAEEALDRAFDMSGGRLFEVYLYRAMLYETKGARLEAATELEKYLAANPDSTKAGELLKAIEKLRGKTGP